MSDPVLSSHMGGENSWRPPCVWQVTILPRAISLGLQVTVARGRVTSRITALHKRLKNINAIQIAIKLPIIVLNTHLTDYLFPYETNERVGRDNIFVLNNPSVCFPKPCSAAEEFITSELQTELQWQIC